MIAAVTVGTNATQILSRPEGSPYKFVAIGNNGSATAYLKVTPDTTAVTTSNGIPLPAGAVMMCDQDAQKELFNGTVTAIVGSGSTVLSVQAF